MRAASSAEPPSSPRPVFAVPSSHRWRMVVMGYIPFLHFITVLAAVALPLAELVPQRWVLAAPFVLYLLPPLVCRIVGLFVRFPDGRFELGSREFLCWWFFAQWQVIFNRLPFLEELLRMVPALYSLWLRVWGSKIGAMVYWSSGVTVLDRSCLEIGDRAVFGVGVALSPHVLMPDASRRVKLWVSPIKIGSDTLVGGHTLLSPGVSVASGEMLPAFLRLPPFCRWQDGKRDRQGAADWTTALALVTPKARANDEGGQEP